MVVVVSQILREQLLPGFLQELFQLLRRNVRTPELLAYGQAGNLNVIQFSDYDGRTICNSARESIAGAKC